MLGTILRPHKTVAYLCRGLLALGCRSSSSSFNCLVPFNAPSPTHAVIARPGRLLLPLTQVWLLVALNSLDGQEPLRTFGASCVANVLSSLVLVWLPFSDALTPSQRASGCLYLSKLWTPLADEPFFWCIPIMHCTGRKHRVCIDCQVL